MLPPKFPIWSILIPTVPSRLRGCFADLFEVVQGQITAQSAPVELLGLADNKYRPLGAKRTAMLQMAQGTYVSFLDDDDCISPHFVEKIVDAILTSPDLDVIVYDQWCSEEGNEPYLCRYGVEFEYGKGAHGWTGKPAHNMVWRREMIADLSFPDLNSGEDVEWCRAASMRVRPAYQMRIPEALYFYNSNKSTSETQGAGLQRDVPAAYREWWAAAVRR